MQTVMRLRCHRRTSFLLIARPPLASGLYGHKGKCQEVPRACATRAYHRQSAVDREFPVSNMHLDTMSFQRRHKSELRRTKVPLLHSLWCLQIDRVCLFDHMLASPPRAHSRCAYGVLLVPTQSRNLLAINALDTEEKYLPYRPSPLYHQGFWCCVLLMVEKKVLVHKDCKPQLRRDRDLGGNSSHPGL